MYEIYKYIYIKKSTFLLQCRLLGLLPLNICIIPKHLISTQDLSRSSNLLL